MTRLLTCQLSHLIEFYLYGNKLINLPQEFGHLTSLEKLGLSENSLTSLPTSMAKLCRLKLLDLRHNKFTEVIYTFVSYPTSPHPLSISFSLPLFHYLSFTISLSIALSLSLYLTQYTYASISPPVCL